MRTSVALLVLGLSAPFLSKPFHIDDPLFVRAGEALARNPGRPYDIAVHWFETTQPMHEVMFNPPAVSYYVALVAKLFGTSESTLHLAFLVPALLFVLGTHRLARRWCPHPALATLAVVATPAFLVSATNVMADVWAAALFTWSVVLWVESVEAAGKRRMLGGALLAGACILSKYAGLATLPILAVHALGRRPRPRGWLPALLVPVAMWGAWELWMHRQTGSWPLEIASRASSQASARSLVDTSLIALAALGGAALAPTLLLLGAGRKRELAVAAGAALVAVTIAIGWRWGALQHPGEVPERAWGIAIQLALLSATGLTSILLLARRLGAVRDTADVTLAVWTAVVLGFAFFLNWSVQARALLPALPPLAILACRALGSEITAVRRRVAISACVVSMGIGVGLNVADQEIARSAKRAAETLVERSLSAGRAVWFQGHWGFLHYAERAGARPMEKDASGVRPGDRVLVPMLNTNVLGVSPRDFSTLAVEEHPLLAPVTTLGRAGNVSFYGSTLGILPFGYGFGEPAAYWVLQRD